MTPLAGANRKNVALWAGGAKWRGLVRADWNFPLKSVQHGNLQTDCGQATVAQRISSGQIPGTASDRVEFRRGQYPPAFRPEASTVALIARTEASS